MYEVRLHGRGGQGVVTAAELLSVAAFLDGHEAQAFPSFGSERMGAPVTAYCRIADSPIRLREPVDEPDGLLVLDASLLHHVDLFSGLRPDGYVLINSSRSVSDLGLDDLVAVHPAGRVTTVAGTEIAREIIGGPQANVCMLGAFAALTGWVGLDSLHSAVRQRFAGTVADRNLLAVDAAVARVDVVAHG